MVAEPSRSTAGLNWGSTGNQQSSLVHDLLPHINPNSTTRPGTLDESLATFLAAPDKPEGVPEDVQIADDGVVNMIWRIMAVLNNFGFTIKDVVDNQNKSTGCLNNSLSYQYPIGQTKWKNDLLLWNLTPQSPVFRRR